MTAEPCVMFGTDGVVRVEGVEVGTWTQNMFGQKQVYPLDGWRMCGPGRDDAVAREFAIAAYRRITERGA